MKKLILFFFFLIVAPVCAAPVIDYNDGVYHIVLNGKEAANKLDFVVTDELTTNYNVHKQSNSFLTVNTGFFDPKNGKTISFINSKWGESADPRFNESLISNPVLNKNLEKILNRSEFRVYECGVSTVYDIVPHNELVKEGCFLQMSAQGGPEIYPNLRLEEEFFIQKDSNGNIIRESCSVLHKTARTIIALKGNDIHLFIITNDNPMTLKEAAEYVKSFGVEKAMGFDGGSSTSFDYKNKIHVVSTQNDGNDTGRKLKSFMIYSK